MSNCKRKLGNFIKKGLTTYTHAETRLSLRTSSASLARRDEVTDSSHTVDLPDAKISAAYEKSATQNVLTAVNPKVFFGYFSVCADGQGFGYGNSYPSLDGHQMTDALLWLGRVEIVKANWEYVRKFQKPDGQLPLAIFPSLAGKAPVQLPVEPNGGLYRHWVPGDPLRALAGTTYIQNADVIFRFTQDKDWLLKQLLSVNLAADFLASLITAEGAVKGAGYYVERPTRIECDGVAQCHAVDAFRRAADLNMIAGHTTAAVRYRKLANRIKIQFRTNFWMRDRFAEYIHPERGAIATHGLTDTDWSAIATGVADAKQTAILWPQLKNEARFYYGGMPTGIATHPEAYESWEFTHNDRMDLAAMGRVWYLECWARARMGDGQGLVDSLRRVCRMGQQHGYFWRERYNEKGGYGAEKYCEYPANLIRIVQRFLLGVDYRLDGSLALAPTIPDKFWNSGFGQTLTWRDRRFSYRMRRDGMTGKYSGKNPQRIRLRFQKPTRKSDLRVTINGHQTKPVVKDGWIVSTLPSAPDENPCYFEVSKIKSRRWSEPPEGFEPPT